MLTTGGDKRSTKEERIGQREEYLIAHNKIDNCKPRRELPFQHRSKLLHVLKNKC